MSTTTEFVLRPAQQEQLRLYYARIQELQEEQRKALSVPVQQFNEAMYFVQLDLGVPQGEREKWVLTPDFAKMVPAPKPSRPAIVVDNTPPKEPAASVVSETDNEPPLPPAA